MYTYTWYQWLAFFYIYCFIGWIFESAYVSLRTKHPVNRGFLRIPMLPLYGSGAVMMLWVSLPVKDNLFLVYLFGVVAATALEYVTGSVMEQLFKIRYWDYSGQRFQIRGYICLSSSVAWGFLTILMTEVIHAPVANAVLNLNQNLLLITVALMTVVFVTDAYESTKAALELGRSLEALTRLKSDIEELQERIHALREEAAEHVSLVKEATSARLSAAKAETMVKLVSLKEETVDGMSAITKNTHGELERLLRLLEEARERRQAILSKSQVIRLHRFYHRGLLKGNPTAASSRFAAALKELREELLKPFDKDSRSEK